VTAGLGNPVIATAELGGSVLLSLLAVAAPLAAVAVVILLLWLAFRLIRRRRHATQRANN
jgi:small neutral amino acid transporter SnatA (MarC family)